jgi:NAD(P)-dependent dehydrogenase (short-subunit alcohol dehydrogenase family)
LEEEMASMAQVQKQHNIVITGATRGIGRNIAMLFARQGYTVVGTGRDSVKLEELEWELKPFSDRSRALAMDIRNPEEVKKVAAQVYEELGGIDVWINNAGVFFAIGPTWEVDPEQWVNDVTTNVIGTFHCIQAVVPLMLRQSGGRIINVVGGGTIGEFKYGNGYGTSKTAIARMTENLAAELEGSGVLAFAMDPGLNDTDMTKYQREAEVGRKYFSFINKMFEQHQDISPHWAPEMAFQLAEGKLDAYNGRIVSANDDAEKLIANAALIVNTDDYKLRISRKDNVYREK